MKRTVIFILIAAMAMSVFTACGQTHVHTWTEPSCTAPRTCAVCGETEGEALGHDWAEATCTAPRTCRRCHVSEGEALGHDWQDATCTEPYTCTRCGETVGESLGHTPTEADYWTPSVCAVCGEELGPVLKPELVSKYGLTNFMSVGDVRRMVFDDHRQTGAEIPIDIEVTRYEVRPTLEDYPRSSGALWTELTEKEGYEWRTVTMVLRSVDDGYYLYGLSSAEFFAEYYEVKDNLPDEYRQETGDGVIWHFPLDIRGETCDITAVMAYHREADHQTRKASCAVDFAFQVPIGFDGYVCGIFDQSKIEAEQDFMNAVTNDCALFRL